MNRVRHLGSPDSSFYVLASALGFQVRSRAESLSRFPSDEGTTLS
jgi:hypothetical protein